MSRRTLVFGRRLPMRPNPFLVAVGGLLEDYRGASYAQEQVAVDLNAPVAKQWVELKRLIIEIADELGIGPEVSAVFEILKAQEIGYVGVTAAGTAGGTIALGTLGGVAGGVIGGAIVVALGIFSSDEGPTIAKQRRDQIRASIWRVLLVPTMESLAAEQNEQAQRMKDVVPHMEFLGADPTPYKKIAATSSKLAQFYRLAAETLSSSEQKLFLAVTFKSRLLALKDYVGSLSTEPISGWGLLSQKQEVYIAFPTLDQELTARLTVADKMIAAAPKATKPKKLASLVKKATSWAIPLAVGGGVLYYFQPDVARRLYGQGKNLATGAFAQGKKTVSTAASLIKKAST